MKKAAAPLMLVAVILLAVAVPAEAQQPKKVPRIGALVPGSRSSTSTYTNAFRQGLRDLGYVEGQNIAFEYRFADGNLDRLSDRAGELVRAKVDVIVAASSAAVLAAKNATKEIPVVFYTINDPVALGVVASLAKPGGNVTGLTTSGAELCGKRLELLKETIPRLTRAAFLWNPMNEPAHLNLKETQAAAQAFKLQIQSLEVRSTEDIEPAFDAATRAKNGAMLTTQIPPITTHRQRIVDLAVKHQLPVIYPETQWPDNGGLMSYGADFVYSHRQLAGYVDRILKGTKPADLPVERATKLELSST